MTYIISGVFNGKHFLMSDCVGTGKDKKTNERIHTYNIKLKPLIGCENRAFFCLTGNEAYSNAISLFDENCYNKNDFFNFQDKQHIQYILDIFEPIKDYYGDEVLNYARLYFVDKSGVYYYDINNEGEISPIKTISNNHYISPSSAANPPSPFKKELKDNKELISFCKNKIIQQQPYEGMDLKDKFSYIIFDNDNIIFDNSIKDNRELALSFIAAGYEEIK